MSRFWILWLSRCAGRDGLWLPSNLLLADLFLQLPLLHLLLVHLNGPSSLPLGSGLAVSRAFRVIGLFVQVLLVFLVLAVQPVVYVIERFLLALLNVGDVGDDLLQVVLVVIFVAVALEF